MPEQSESQRLHWGSINVLTINNLVRNAKGERVPLSLCRHGPVEEDGKIMLTELEPTEGSTKFELEVSIKDKLGHGRCGTVFETTQEYLWENTRPESEAIQYPGLEYLPPVVLKVADEKTYLDLGREAMNYGILNSLHGVAIPRFYGWFNLLLEKGLTFPGVKCTDNNRRMLSVMVLERMGDRLTTKESEEDLEDLRDVVRDVAWKRVEHYDIEYRNVFQAPKSPPGYLGEFCRRHQRIHRYRVIDFEEAKKLDDIKTYYIAAYHIQQVRSMVEKWRQ
ncbi:hypothetical protein BDQ17DRAFT_1350415 [Cyathus striatus]|nr:hypothetical protein BDQ17DRAFT_1350415 [Cyathus striatus]